MKNKLKISISRPVSIREKVYKALRNDILGGRFAPGERLVEAQVAKQIKTSRTPVREALHMLEREGILESIPRVGYRVKQLRLDEIEEICEIRAVNETLAARWAMARLSAKGKAALEENLAKAKKVVASGNPRAFVEYDAEFHEIIARESGSERLLELCQLLRNHMLRYRIDSILHAETVLCAISEHERILDCICSQDEKGVEQAIRDHLESSKASIIRHALGHTATDEAESRRPVAGSTHDRQE